MTDTDGAQQNDAAAAPARTATPSTPSRAKSEDAVRYPVEQLLQEAPVRFRVEPYVLAGALEGTRTKTLTLEQAQDALKTFTERTINAPEEN